MKRDGWLIGNEVRRTLLHYWRVAGARPWHLGLPLALALMIGAVEGGSFAMLIPLADGIAVNSFDALRGSSAFGWIFRVLPADIVASPRRDAWIALLIIAAIFGGRFLKLGLEYVRKAFTDRRNERYSALVREETFGRVLGFGRQYFDRQALGHIDGEIGWSNSAVLLLAAAEGLFLSLFRLVAKGTLMLAISLPLALTTVIAFPLIQVLTRRLATTAGEIAREAAEAEVHMRREVLDLLATIPLIKAHSQERQALATYARILETTRGLELRRQRLRQLKNPVQEGVILLAVLVVEGLSLWWANDFRPGELARFCAFLLVAQQCLPDFIALSELRFKVLEQVPLLEALSGLFRDEGKFIVHSGPRQFEGLKHGIEVKGLSFHYQPANEVLHDLHAFIPAARVTALVGESGAGKTSFVDLISRFYDCAPGTILLDGTDIREFSTESLHGRMAIVSQDVWLLNRSVRANLTFGLVRPPEDDELWEILQDVELAELVESLPAGLETEIGDRGVRLSGGQRQRLALARALLRDPDILVLDEATASLDSVLERRIEGAVERRAHGRTLIVIAHRLSTIRGADLILVMDGGRIVESGNWDQLLARQGAFERLHRAQFGRVRLAAP